MLGIFDSGVGGITVVRNVRANLPNADIIFLADQGRVPYGDRSDAELRRYLHENVAFLEANGASAIVMGCNTTCAIAARYGWPPSSIAILDLIESAALAVAASDAKRIGVIATRATIRSGAYGDAIRAHVEGARVQEIAAPALVPLVESGQLEGEIARRAVAHACEEFQRDLDVLILACTHYPLLDAHFAAALGNGVTRIDPAVVQAERACALPRAGEGDGRMRLVTTGDEGAFDRAVRGLVPAAALARATFETWHPVLAAGPGTR